MAAHIDILEERESLRRPLLGSIVLHVTVFALIALQSLVGRQTRELWGHPDSLGGSAVGITPVTQIPLPARGGPANPLASDTESRVPEPPKPKPQTRQQETDEESAIAIKARSSAKPSRRQQTSRSRAFRQAEERRGQLYSDTGRALSSSMIGRTGSGGVGIGTGGAFGNRFGAYRDLLEQRIAQRWRTDDVDPRLDTAPPAIITFMIYRNGSTSSVRVEQSSGNKMLDNSALRAVYEASPFPALPAGYERDDARIEIWFQLRR
jgi:TonB family protein